MAKHKNNQRGKSNMRRSPPVFNGTRDEDQKVFRADFRLYAPPSSASNTAGALSFTEIDLSPPNWGARGIAFADLYSKYRIVGLQARLGPRPGLTTTATSAMYMPGNATWYMAIYYGPSTTFTAPVALTTFIDLPHLTWSNDRSTRILLRMSRSDCMRHLEHKWLQTASSGTGGQTETTQFCLEIVASTEAATTVQAAADLVIDFQVEFTGSVDPALIPERAKLREQQLRDSALLVPASPIGPLTERKEGPLTKMVDSKSSNRKTSDGSWFG